MARDFSKVMSTYWTGSTGRQIRSMGCECQLVSLYLITCPSSNAIGLYYLPIPIIAHETGMSNEGASKALRRLSEAGFAHYDEASEVVYVPEMARIQIADSISPKDNIRKFILCEANKYRKSIFFKDFVARYSDVFHLKELSPYEPPLEALRSQEIEIEIEREREIEQERNGAVPAHSKIKTPRPKSSSPQVVEIPPALKFEPFIASWEKWVGVRRKRKWSCEFECLSSQLASLAPIGPTLASECLELSVRSGWQGIFPEKFVQRKVAVGPGQVHDPSAAMRDANHGKL